MHPVITWQANRIMSYDLLQIFAYIAFSIYMFHALEALKIPKIQIYGMIYVGFVVQYMGGMLLPLVHRWIFFHQMPQFDIWAKSPGRYFHSVVLSMMTFVVLVGLAFRWPLKKVLDHYLIGVMLASAIGRIGCFMQGCCSGKPSTLPWALHYPQYPNISLHPTQLYMFLSELILFFALLFFYHRKRKYDGQTFWVAVAAYSVYRFLIEFLRINPVFILGLTHAQVFSLTCFVAACGILFYFRKKTLPAPALKKRS